MESVRQIFMKLKASSNEGLLMKVFSHSLMWISKHCSGHYVTTQACTIISWGCVHLRWCGALEDYTLCWAITCDTFKLGLPNFDQKCKTPGYGRYCFGGAMDLDLQGQISLQIKFYSILSFKFVHMRTYHPFKLRSPNLEQRCKISW